MPRRRLSISRACSSQISAMPASEKLRPFLIFLSSMSMQDALDDVADLLHVDGEADDVGPAPAFLLAQRLARDLGQVVLDGRVELVDRVVELAQFLGQPQVVVLDHAQHAEQHGLDDVGLVQRLARGAGDGQRRRGQRRRVQVVRPAGHHGACPAWAASCSTQRATTCVKPMKQQADQHVEGQVEQHHHRAPASGR